MGLLNRMEIIRGCIYNSCLLSYKKIQIGRNVSINGAIRLRGDGKNLIIGDNVTINSGWRMNPTGGNERTGFALYGGKIIIGNNVGLSNVNIVCTTKVDIEDDVIIGSGVTILDSNFHSVQYDYRMQTPDLHIKSKAIKIKKGAFIGAYSIVLKGVVIGEKSVIAAGSVVVRSVPDNEIWGGNPAVFIKKI